MNNRYPFVNEPLPYAYNALEPYIDEKTMHLHHDRHLQTYIDNLNAFLKENPDLQNYTLEELASINRNAGGVYNHRFYFDGLRPPKPARLDPLCKEIEEQFEGFDAFKQIFKQEALSVFGSGYTWLVSENGLLKILNTANQDIPDLNIFVPLLCIDVWEHAYYLKHYNLRGDYIDDWFSVVDWEKAGKRYREKL